MVEIRTGDNVLTLDWSAWEDRVRRGEVPHDALVRSAALTGGAWVRADSLESFRQLASSGVGAFERAQASGGPPIATALLIGLQIRLVWWAQTGSFANFLETHFTKWDAPTLEDAQIWRPITMGFIHTDLLTHALPNMVWLAYVAYQLERALGWRTMIWLYVMSVAGGSFLSMAAAPYTPSIGASGGAFGLVAACVVFGLTRAEILPESARRVFGFALFPYVALMLVMGFMGNEGADNWAHLGGALLGGPLAMVVSPPGMDRYVGGTVRWRRGTTAVLIAVLIGLGLLGPSIEAIRPEAEATAFAIRRKSGGRVTPVVDAGPVHAFVPAGWERGATESGDVGWVSPLAARAWSVNEEQTDRPQTLDQRHAKWRDRVLAAYPDAKLGDPVPAKLAGQPALRVDGSLPTTPPRVVRWLGAVRGRHAVDAVWESDVANAGHLEPLRDRLLAATRWDPPALAEVQAKLDADPANREARRALAAALADEGLGREAIAALADAATDAVVPAKDRALLAKILSWYPDAVSDGDARLDGMLHGDNSPTVVAAVADTLDAWGRAEEARGLLEIAWWKAPGERTLARARQARRLSVEIDATGALPELVWDAVEARRRTPTEIAARRALPLDLPTAAVWGPAVEPEPPAAPDAPEPERPPIAPQPPAPTPP